MPDGSLPWTLAASQTIAGPPAACERPLREARARAAIALSRARLRGDDAMA